jgi:hypothetical protein
VPGVIVMLCFWDSERNSVLPSMEKEAFLPNFFRYRSESSNVQVEGFLAKCAQ